MATDARGPVVELVVLLASAGGLKSLSTVLGDLPATLPAAIVVQQHLAAHDSALPAILARETGRRVDWARGGQSLEAGQVVVGPPGMHMELTRDGRCHLRELVEPGDLRFDVLLKSVAGSYGPRSVAAVLSGSGRDGAAGVAEMKRAGAIVIAESPLTAQYPSMPIAAARAGADLVLPVFEIGQALADIVAGAPLPAPWPGQPSSPATAEEGTTAMASSMDQIRGDGLDEELLDHSVTNAAGRAEIARLRADELRRRRADLAAGLGATAQTEDTARRRAQESRRRAQLAHQASEEAAARWGR